MQVMATEAPWLGKPLAEYIAHIAASGVRVIYSDDLVTADLIIQQEPGDSDPIAALRTAAGMHGLRLVRGPGGNWLIVADPDASAVQKSAVTQAPRLIPDTLPEIIVSSSVYSIGYQQPGSHTFLDQDFASDLPDVGEEALRSIDRLPGVASGGISTRSHIRGGSSNEQLILLDGLRLYEPYHLKDFHSLASIVSQNAIDGIDFYSAGYQARYGDRMSGVVDIKLRPKPDETQTELGLSLLNTSAMSAGRFFADKSGDWLVTARRSNLDIISRAVKKGYGEPQFEDVLAHVGWQWNERTYVAANFLYSRDRIAISQADKTESAIARYRNNVGWLKVDFDWSDAISVSTIVSATDIENSRDGEVDVANTVAGTVVDSRDFSFLGIKQDWQLRLNDRWLLRTGLSFNVQDAEYDYESELTISSPFDQILDNRPFLQRNISERPEGEQYAAYAEARWKIRENFIVDLGLRFDRQTYSAAKSNEQRSPRLNLLYKIGERTELRAGFGRFYQAQEINELQINDGLTAFFPPQYADHLVASLAHSFRNAVDLRLELYQKSYNDLIPRFENVFNPLVMLPELQIDRARIDPKRAVVQGAEITVSGDLADDASHWWFGYTWSEAHDSIGGDEIQRSWDQTHSVKLGALTEWRRWTLSAAGNWNSGWPKTELIFAPPSTTPRNKLNLSSFFSLDIRASRDFQLRRSELTAFFEVSNILNRENTCCTEYSMTLNDDGSTTLLSEKENWLPLVPSIGVVWRF